MKKGYKIKTGDIFKLKSNFCKGGTHCKITFPLPKGGESGYYVIDAVPCNAAGEEVKGYEIGVPMSVKDFGKLVGNSNDC